MLAAGPSKHICILYTGGTFGCIQGKPEPLDVLRPVADQYLQLMRPGATYEWAEVEKPIDSSNASPLTWQMLADEVDRIWQTRKYSGIVVISGTDTMAYTCSALSFLLRCQTFPVVVTGSQVPIFEPGSDAPSNLYGAIVAAAYETKERKNCIMEVGLFFNHHLFRGNRAKKVHTDSFHAFHSPQAAVLGYVYGSADFDDYIINYIADKRQEAIAKDRKKLEQSSKNMAEKPESKTLFQPPTEGYKKYTLDERVVLCTFFPGINSMHLKALASNESVGMVLEAYGSGNGPEELFETLKQLSDKIIIVAVTQCIAGAASEKYATSLTKCKVIVCRDITAEAAFAKLCVLLGKFKDMTMSQRSEKFLEIYERVKRKMLTSHRGEQESTAHSRTPDRIQGGF